ncbi:MAG: hypothetical protein ACI4P4_13035 [Faecousia sp.]
MKRFLSIAFVFVMLMLVIYGIIPKNNINSNDEVKLIHIYDEQDIQVVLPDDEASKIRDIMDGKIYYLFPGTPACGFLKCYGFSIGDTFYAVAIDSCGTIMNCSSDQYFGVSEEELNYIHSLFEKYDR